MIELHLGGSLARHFGQQALNLTLRLRQARQKLWPQGVVQGRTTSSRQMLQASSSWTMPSLTVSRRMERQEE